MQRRKQRMRRQTWPGAAGMAMPARNEKGAAVAEQHRKPGQPMHRPSAAARAEVSSQFITHPTLPPTLACRSASLYTATVGTPSRCAVVSTRHAISPRLATSNLSIAGRPAPPAAALLLLSARRPCQGLPRASAACRPAASRRRTLPRRIAAARGRGQRLREPAAG